MKRNITVFLTALLFLVSVSCCALGEAESRFVTIQEWLEAKGETSMILEFGNKERILNGYWMVIANPRYTFYGGTIEMADWTLLRLVPGIE